MTLSISARALERTLQRQLFRGPQGRYYIRGRADGGCYVYASDPKVSFRGNRIVVHVDTHAKLGTSVHGECMGITLGIEADVSMLPEAEGDSIGFRDARVENLQSTAQLNAFLEPFLNCKLPQQMKINAADLLRRLLGSSAQSIGYDLSLRNLTVRSMQVQEDSLLVDLDAAVDLR